MTSRTRRKGQHNAAGTAARGAPAAGGAPHYGDELANDIKRSQKRETGPSDAHGPGIHPSQKTTDRPSAAPSLRPDAIGLSQDPDGRGLAAPSPEHAHEWAMITLCVHCGKWKWPRVKVVEPKPADPIKDHVDTGSPCPRPAPCCDRAGEYNGFGSDGPLLFRCPEGCSCHD